MTKLRQHGPLYVHCALRQEDTRADVGNLKIYIKIIYFKVYFQIGNYSQYLSI